ncbi:response regulator transcription factor [Paenibacillus sp.]|uniref:response regulator transcription factor n=1 Tax=Paenibacillus sp. TaxID=58172 RepID=UPI002D42314A|nr:response regulator [Paenibacillus sp.]HZG56462.1 response regulator [Paenibacillus sp.]
MRRVLIVDDEPWAREVVKSLAAWARLRLEVAGEAEDGDEALALIETLRPDIVVTDMRMPGVDGIQLLQAMKDRFPRLKIVVMSGYDDFAYLKQAIQSRAVEYMLKPIDPDELNAALARCVSELESLERTVHTSWRAPLVLPEPGMTERYAALRQRAFAALFELNTAAARQSFEKLGELLDAAYPGGLDRAMREKVQGDFLQVLEEFTAERPGELPAPPRRDVPDAAGGDAGGAAALRAIAEAYAEAIEGIERFRRSKTRLILDEVTAYIDAQYADPITLETIARRFYVSKEHLSRTFKLATGETVTDAIVARRIGKAKELLLRPGVSIKDVASMVGYPDLPYFHRIFKKETGITPGEFREGGRN